MSVGGKIVSVSKEADSTRVVIDILGEENIVFVPAKALPKDAGSLKPGNFLVADGHPHKTDKLKMLADSVTVSKP